MSIDTSELHALSRDLGKVSAGTTKAMYGVINEAATDLRDTWRNNARASSGEHGKHYPNSITHDMRVGLGISAEIGPDANLPQGGMSFEYGSANQTPHLGGQMAADSEIPKVDRRIDTALAYLMGQAGL